MKTKNKSLIVHDNIKSLAVQRLGELEIRVVDAAKQFGITLLHESLPSCGEAPYVVHSRTIELVYMVSGTIFGFLDGQKIKLKKGDYLFIPAGMEHKFEAGVCGGEAISIFSPPMDLSKPDAKIVFNKKSAKTKRKK